MGWDNTYNRVEKSFYEDVIEYLKRSGLGVWLDTNCYVKNSGKNQQTRADLMYLNNKNEVCCFEIKSSPSRINLVQFLNMFPDGHETGQNYNIDRYYIITPQYCYDFTSLKKESIETIKNVEKNLASLAHDSTLNLYRVFEIQGNTLSSPFSPLSGDNNTRNTDENKKISLKPLFLRSYFESIFDDLLTFMSVIHWGNSTNDTKPFLAVLFYIIKEYKEPDNNQKTQSLLLEDSRLLGVYEYVKEIMTDESTTSTSFNTGVKYCLSSNIFNPIISSKTMHEDRSISVQDFINNNIQDFTDYFISKFIKTKAYPNESPLKFISYLYPESSKILSINHGYSTKIVDLWENRNVESYIDADDWYALSLLTSIAYNLDDNIHLGRAYSTRDRKVELLNDVSIKEHDLVYIDLCSVDDKEIYLTLSYLIENLSNKSKLLVLLPKKWMFASANKCIGIRKKMIDDNILDFVINLPDIGHSKHSNIICLFGINKSKQDDKVSFFNFKTSQEYRDLIMNNMVRRYRSHEGMANFIHNDRSSNFNISRIKDENYLLDTNRYLIKHPDGFEEATPLRELFSYEPGKRKSEERGVMIRIRDLANEKETNKEIDADRFKIEKLRKGCRKIQKDVILLSRIRHLKPTIFKYKDVPIYVDPGSVLAFDISQYNKNEIIKIIEELNSDFVKLQFNKFSIGYSHFNHIKREDLEKIRLRERNFDLINIDQIELLNKRLTKEKERLQEERIKEQEERSVKMIKEKIKEIQERLLQEGLSPAESVDLNEDLLRMTDSMAKEILHKSSDFKSEMQMVLGKAESEFPEVRHIWSVWENYQKYIHEIIKKYIYRIEEFSEELTNLRNYQEDIIEKQHDMSKSLRKIKKRTRYLKIKDASLESLLEKFRGQLKQLKSLDMKKYTFEDIDLYKFMQEYLEDNQEMFTDVQFNEEISEYLMVDSDEKGIFDVDMTVSIFQDDFKSCLGEMLYNINSHGFNKNSEDKKILIMYSHEERNGTSFVSVSFYNNGMPFEDSQVIINEDDTDVSKGITSSGDRERGQGRSIIKKNIDRMKGRFSLSKSDRKEWSVVYKFMFPLKI